MRTKQQIHRETKAILSEFTDRYPILSTVAVRVSARMTRSGGSARFRGGVPYEIVLSLPFYAEPTNNLRRTVVHEAAHVIAGIAAGHGPVWRLLDISMGGDGSRCHDMTLAQGYTARRNRAVKSACSKCGQPILLGPGQAKKAARGASYSHSKCPR